MSPSAETDAEYEERHRKEWNARYSQALAQARQSQEFLKLLQSKLIEDDLDMLAAQNSRAVILSVTDRLDDMTVKEVKTMDGRLMDELIRLEARRDLINLTRETMRKHSGVGAPLTD